MSALRGLQPFTGTRAAALLVIVASCAAACTAQPVRTGSELVADRALAARVERALADDPQVYARHVEVDAREGVVYLSGFVWSTHDLYSTRAIAANVPGVNRVNSELELMVGGRNGR